MKGFKQRLDSQLLGMLWKECLSKDILLKDSFNVIEENPIDKIPSVSSFPPSDFNTMLVNNSNNKEKKNPGQKPKKGAQLHPALSHQTTTVICLDLNF